MAYSIKYLFKFVSAAGTTREIRVLKDGYSGDVIQRPLGRAPMLKKQQNGPVHGTSLEFFAECNVDREFIEFYTSNPKDYRVDLYAGSTLLWQGYITPELYSEPDIAPPYDVQVVATDGVGELKLYDYAVQGTVTLRTLLSGLLSRTGLGTDIYLISSIKPGSAGAGSLLEKTINLDYMAGKTCYEVLTYLLDTLHATITWWKGAWILTRETNVTFTNGKVRYFNTAGNSALLNDSVQVLGKMRTNPAWPVGQLSTVIDPAKNKVTVQAPLHPATPLANPGITSDTGWAKSNNAAWSSGHYYLPYNDPTAPVDWNTAAMISQSVSLISLRMSYTVKCRFGLSDQALYVSNAVGYLALEVVFRAHGVDYFLAENPDGGYEWTTQASSYSCLANTTRVSPDGLAAEELAIELPPLYLSPGGYPIGQLSISIKGADVDVYSASFDVIVPKGYQDILRIDNGARGEGSNVEIAIGRETSDNAYYAAFLQGILLDSGSPITSFSDANFTAGMDYLAFIARDYALSVALPRAKVTGTVYLEDSVQIPPLVFSKGGLDYWLETWGWNLYEDELEISAVTLPSASLTVQSETILESNESTVSSAGGAGSPGSSMGGGANYFEPNAELRTLIQLKSAYTYIGARKGLVFDGNSQADANADFEKVAIPGGGYALHSRLPFYSDSFISAGGLSPGGGSAGGNAILQAQTYGGTLSATGIPAINFYSKERVDSLLASAGTVQSVAGVFPVNRDIPVASLQTALGLGAAAAYAVATTVSQSDNTHLVTGGAVWSAINTNSIVFNQDITSPVATNQMGYGYLRSGWTTTGPAMTFGSGRYTAQIQSSAAGNELYYRQTVNGTPQSWVSLWHSGNLTQSVITNLIGGTTYAPYNANGYLPLSAGSSYPLTGTLFVALNQGIVSPGSSYSMIFQDSSFATYVGQPDSMTIIRSSNNNLVHRKVSTDYTIWDASNLTPGNFVLKAGDTMTGNLALGDADRYAVLVKDIVFSVTSGWARDIMQIKVDGSSKFGIGAFGSYTAGSSGNGITYAYIGCNAYDGLNLRVSPSSLVFGAFTATAAGVDVSGSDGLTVTQPSSANWPTSVKAMTPNIPVGGTHAILIGRTNDTGNSGSISFRYQGSASTANSLSLGFHTKDFVINAFYSGNVTIGTDNTTDYGHRLYVAGGIVATGCVTAGQTNSSSDARLKGNIKDFAYSSALLMAIKPREWDWNGYSNLEGHSAGIVAQEIQGLMPYAVGSISDERLGSHFTMNYDTLHAVEIAGLQDHERRIAELERENAELRKRLMMD